MLWGRGCFVGFNSYINIGSESVHGAVEGEGFDQQRDHDHVGEQRSEPDHVAALVEAAPEGPKYSTLN